LLISLSLKNFATVAKLNLELASGMTALTGESGTGKSILIDAVELILGSRGNTTLIRHGSERAEISAIFSVQNIPTAQQWLAENDFSATDDEILLRRNITKDGRSRQFINGEACTQQQMRQLGELLVNINSQHQHQRLTQRTYQRDLLDSHGTYGTLLEQINVCYQKIQTIKQQLNHLEGERGNGDAKLSLLQYQVQELQDLALSDNEIGKLESEHQQLTHAEQLQANVQTALQAIDTHETKTATTLINQAQKALEAIRHAAPVLQSSIDMLNTATIQLQETRTELQHFLDNIEINPEHLLEVEHRLQQIRDVARKHHVEPETLPELQYELTQQLEQLQHIDKHQTTLQQQCKQYQEQYVATAAKLSKQRQFAAKNLSMLVTKNMQRLNMHSGKFTIQLLPLDAGEISAQGAELIEFLVSTNIGQPLQPLHKVASGGELSRINLALQVVAAQKDNTPTLIFDEVDVGIGGATAEIVGNLLREVGKKAQAICITHLPQVAAQAQHHLRVQKNTVEKETTTGILSLSHQSRIEEIARMLGGTKITQQTIKHATEMLTQYSV